MSHRETRRNVKRAVLFVTPHGNAAMGDGSWRGSDNEQKQPHEKSRDAEHSHLTDNVGVGIFNLVRRSDVGNMTVPHICVFVYRAGLSEQPIEEERI